MKSLFRKSPASGFTLIELLVVIAIIGILSTAGFVTFSSSQARARDTSRTADLRRFEGMMETYFADHGSYPLSTTDYGVAGHPWGSSWEGYGTLPKDPLDGHKYVYVSNGSSYQFYTKFENESTNQAFSCGTCGPNSKCNGGLTSPGSSLTSFSTSPTANCSTPIPPPPPAPTVSLAASPPSINWGLSSTLTWFSTNVTSCTASGAWSGTKGASGTQSVSPTSSSTYILACTGSGGTVSSSATVTVTLLDDRGTCSSDSNCTSRHCYVDEDTDGYAPASGGTKRCQPNAQSAGFDCDDANRDAHPGQTACFTTPRSNGSFDYDCDGEIEKQLSISVTSCSLTTSCNLGCGGYNYTVQSTPINCGEDFYECHMEYYYSNPPENANNCNLSGNDHIDNNFTVCSGSVSPGGVTWRGAKSATRFYWGKNCCQ